MRYIILFLAVATILYPQSIRFEEHTLATDLGNGYQVVPFDVNNDGKMDLIALGTTMTEVVWFENPTWERHVLATNLSHPINLAAWKPSAQAKPQIVVASGFAMEAAKSTGILSLLRPGENVRQPWSATEIDRLPTSHRLRWADIEGNGRKVLVDAPLTGEGASAPDYRGHIPLVYYRPGEWKRERISDAEEGILHGIFVTDWDHNGRDRILIGSFLGVHLYRFGDDGVWSRTEITKGDPDPWPKSGTSDIAMGWLTKERFLATIEPFHGNEVVLYRQHDGAWNREVIDDSLLEAHTIVTGDLNGDGRDEIVAGFRGKRSGVYIYSFDGRKWNRQILDGNGMAASACSIVDLDNDGRLDIVCIGFSTKNLKLYRNLGVR